MLDLSCCVQVAKEEIEKQGLRPEVYLLSEPLAAALIRAQICQRTNGKTHAIEECTTEETQECVKRLSSKKDMGVLTLRLQYSFENTCVQVDQLSKNAKENTERSQQRHLQKVLECENLHIAKNISTLYKSIYEYLLSFESDEEHSRLTEREIAAALQSVFPKAEIPTYQRSSPEIKELEITRIPCLVIGVRLFNKFNEKGGNGIPDLRNSALKHYDSLLKELENEIQLEKKQIKKYEEVLNHEHKNPGSISSRVSELQQELAYRQQYLFYTREIQQNSLKQYNQLQSDCSHYDIDLQNIKQIMDGKMAIAKSKVFPYFQTLGKIYFSFRDSLNFLQKQKISWNQLLVFKNEHFHSTLNPQDFNIIDKNPAPLAFSILSKISTDTKSELFRIPKTGLQNKTNKISLEIQGFCVVCLTDRRGFAIKGNLDFGVIKYKKFYYSFYAPEAMVAFAEDPEKYLDRFAKVGVSFPWFIRLLNIQNQLLSLALPQRSSEREILKPVPFENFAEARITGFIKKSIGINTPTHILTHAERDPHYHWNEWQMRRDALKWTNLRTKKTSSCQTNDSHFKRDAQTQDYLKFPNKDETMPGVECQTMRDDSTSMPVVSKYIAGLRGMPGSKPHIVELRLDWDQQRKREF